METGYVNTMKGQVKVAGRERRTNSCQMQRMHSYKKLLETWVATCPLM